MKDDTNCNCRQAAQSSESTRGSSGTCDSTRYVASLERFCGFEFVVSVKDLGGLDHHRVISTTARAQFRSAQTPTWVLQTPKSLSDGCDTSDETPFVDPDLFAPLGSTPEPEMTEADRCAIESLIKRSAFPGQNPATTSSPELGVDKPILLVPAGLGVLKPQLAPVVWTADTIKSSTTPPVEGAASEIAAKPLPTSNAAPLGSPIGLISSDTLAVDMADINGLEHLVEGALFAITTAFITVKRIMACTKRQQIQWWRAVQRSEPQFVLPGQNNPDVRPRNYLGDTTCDEITRIYDLGMVLALAGARLTAGAYDGKFQPAYRFVRHSEPCDGQNRECHVQEDDEQILVCSDWGFRNPRRDVVALIAALVSGEFGVVNLETDQVSDFHNAYNIAEWVYDRHQQFGFVRCTSFREWDERPDSALFPQLEQYQAYKTNATKVTPPSRVNKIARAWERGWKWVEAGWRYLYRMGLYYERLREGIEGPWDSTIDPEQALVELWNFGGPYNWLSPLWEAQGYTRPTASRACTPEIDLCRDPSNSYRVSLSAYFGDYSHEKFLTVWWTITALAGRFQGSFPNAYMSSFMTHTTFHIELSAKRAYAWPDGAIFLRKDFFQDASGETSYNDVELYRGRTIVHEMFHYLVKGANGGRPRDVWDPSCDSDHGNNKCYGEKDAISLARSNPKEAIKNVSNYTYWLYSRYRRWCGDWPPSTDVAPGERYYPDPISDEEFELFRFGHVNPSGWQMLRTVRDHLVGSDWKPF